MGRAHAGIFIPSKDNFEAFDWNLPLGSFKMELWQALIFLAITIVISVFVMELTYAKEKPVSHPEIKRGKKSILSGRCNVFSL